MSDKLKKIIKKEILEKQLGGRAASPGAAPANTTRMPAGGGVSNVGDFKS